MYGYTKHIEDLVSEKPEEKRQPKTPSDRGFALGRRQPRASEGEERTLLDNLVNR
jgi:hypothetical protein